MERKNKIQKEYLRRTRKLLETKPSCRNLIKGINTWAAPSLDIPDLFWNGPEMNLNEWRKEQENLWLCIRHYIPETTLTDDMYQERVRKRTCSIEDSVDASIKRLEDYIQKHDGGLNTAIRNDTDNTMDNRMTITRKQKWEGKQFYGLWFDFHMTDRLAITVHNFACHVLMYFSVDETLIP